jgi:glutamine phosphoribosylpyrophosphate amidotransferase
MRREYSNVQRLAMDYDWQMRLVCFGYARRKNIRTIKLDISCAVQEWTGYEAPVYARNLKEPWRETIYIARRDSVVKQISVSRWQVRIWYTS